MNRSSFLVAIAAASVSLSASAAVYRWVDNEGHVHYTDKPVQNSEPVDIHTGQPKSSDSSSTSSGDTNLSGDQLAQKKSECEQKKKQYSSYATAHKIVETDSLGRQHEYTPEEMKQLAEKTQQQMQEVCAAAGISAMPLQPLPSAAASDAAGTPPPPQQ